MSRLSLGSLAVGLTLGLPLLLCYLNKSADANTVAEAAVGFFE